jgi:uncharacterized iron-regulated membrane protein
MSNEGHNAKVPHGGAIGLVFVIGLVVGCIVVFLAVAGRTQTVIQQRRELLHEKQAKANELQKAGPDASAPVDPTSPAAAASAPSTVPAPVESNETPASSGNVAP